MLDLKEFLLSVWRNITIEPVVMLYLASMGLNEASELQFLCFDLPKIDRGKERGRNDKIREKERERERERERKSER